MKDDAKVAPPALHILDPDVIEVLADLEGDLGAEWAELQRTDELSPTTVTANQDAFSVIEEMGAEAEGLVVSDILDGGGVILGSSKRSRPHRYLVQPDGTIATGVRSPTPVLARRRAPELVVAYQCGAFPTQTIGDTYEAAIEQARQLTEPEALHFWTREDVADLAYQALGRMLLEDPVVDWLGPGKEPSDPSDELGDDLGEGFEDDPFEDPDDLPYDAEGGTYVELRTRLGRVFGSGGSSWGLALARALGAYEELRARASFDIVPIEQRDAFDFVRAVHRHHAPPPGWKFGLGAFAKVNDQPSLVGVVIVGRTESRELQDQGEFEVTRLAVLEGGQNLCSALYAAAWRQARERGMKRLVTFILETESGVSLKAAGWRLVATTSQSKGGSWDRPGRPRVDKAPTCPKQRWEKP